MASVELSKNKILQIFLVIIFGSLFLLFYSSLNESSKKKMELNLTFTEFGQPESYDPIEADKAVNLSVMRLLYTTPLYVNKSNKITSYVLESFDVDTTNKRILFKVRDNIHFENGKKITANDIATTIARFGYFHPDFPIIEQIIGLKDWAKSKKGLYKLPPGIVVDSNDVQIKLTNLKKNALFRFCLEVFSIIPIDEIDLDTGKLKVKIPSFSGPYRQVNSTDQKLEFVQRVFENFGDDLNYNKITFEYLKLNSFCNNPINDNQVIVAGELEYSFNECFSENMNTSWLGATRFLALLFNPNDQAFNTNEKRKYFSNLVRNKIITRFSKLQVEASIFTKITPGYLSKTSLSSNLNFTQNTIDSFRGKQIKLFRTNPYVPELFKILEIVANDLGMNIIYVDSPNSNLERINMFLNNNVSVNIGGSGFWPIDPSGDVKMFFTKQLHKGLSFIWQDNSLYELISKIDDEKFDINSENIFETINQHLFDQSLLAPIVHYRRLYITKNSQKLEDIPQGITSPAPWQLRIQ